MDKLKMAHDWAMKYGSPENFKLTVDEAWEYADAMQAEADKRNASVDREERIDRFTKAIKEGISNANAEEWQPDWSQAPEWADKWVMVNETWADWVSDDDSNWCKAPTFGYTGSWQDSLRKRPNT